MSADAEAKGLVAGSAAVGVDDRIVIGVESTRW
jgi:hypothetical protein